MLVLSFINTINFLKADVESSLTSQTETNAHSDTLNSYFSHPYLKGVYLEIENFATL